MRAPWAGDLPVPFPFPVAAQAQVPSPAPTPVPPPGSRVAVRFSDGTDYFGTVADVLDENRATVAYDDGQSEAVRFPDPDVRVTRVGPGSVWAAAPATTTAPPTTAAPAPDPHAPIPLGSKHPEAPTAPQHVVPIRVGRQFQVDAAVLAQPPRARVAYRAPRAWPRAVAPSCGRPAGAPGFEAYDGELDAPRSAWALDPAGPVAQERGPRRGRVFLRHGANVLGRRPGAGLTDRRLSRDQCNILVDRRNQVWAECLAQYAGCVSVNGLELELGAGHRQPLEAGDEVALRGTHDTYCLVLLGAGPRAAPGTDRARAARAAHRAQTARAEALAADREPLAERVWAAPTTPAALGALGHLLDLVEPGAEEETIHEAFGGGLPWARVVATRRRGAAAVVEAWAGVGPYAVAASILRHQRHYHSVAREFGVAARQVQTYLYAVLKPQFPFIFVELKRALHQRRARTGRSEVYPEGTGGLSLVPVPYEEDGNAEFCHICQLMGDLLCCDGCERAVHLRCAGLATIPEGDWFCSAACAARGKLPEAEAEAEAEAGA